MIQKTPKSSSLAYWCGASYILVIVFFLLTLDIKININLEQNINSETTTIPVANIFLTL